MKKIQHCFKKIGVYVGCIIFLSSSANAATFTAVASGNFSSTTTWGGTAPSGSIVGDVIIIPSGVNVNMDQNVQLNGLLSTLTVNGTLTSTNGSYMAMTLGNLSGNGTITVDSISTALTTGISFTGSIVAKQFTSLGSTFSSSANITVNNSLNLMAGMLTMASGNITLASNATIVVSGGGFSTTGGVANLTNAYNVIYINSSATTGVEITGSGLKNVEINLPASSSVTLSSDLAVNGTLTLTSGMLVLNNNDLSFSSGGNLSASGSGTISSTSGSSLSLTSTGGLTGALRFTTGANTVNNLTVNMGAGSSATLGTNLNVNGQLNLQSGMLNVGANNLSIAASGTVMGGSSSSYVITGVGGRVTMNLNAGNSGTFQVGTTTRYAPSIITANSGAASGMVSVGVNPSVYAQGTSGSMLSSTGSVVDATWYVTSTATTNVNLNMEVMWSANMEVNSFDRTKAYISHYTNGSWDIETQTSATTATNGMFSIKRNNITSLSPFAVMDSKTIGINEVASSGDVMMYPNPAVNNISIVNTGKYNQVNIYSTSGTLVKSATLTANTNTIAVNDLPAGVYFAHFNGADAKHVQKLIKQ